MAHIAGWSKDAASVPRVRVRVKLMDLLDARRSGPDGSREVVPRSFMFGDSCVHVAHVSVYFEFGCDVRKM